MLVQLLCHQGSDIEYNSCREQGSQKSLQAGPQPFSVQDNLLVCNRPHSFQEILDV